ncbi:ankyrin-2 isoform X3 [Ixodes scapularis]|nr:ankyrin-2 isoform X3 [Ixodes scapularis]
MVTMVTQGEQQTDGNASFLRAARAGNLEKVLEYLKGSIDINTSNANGLNALHLAAKEGHVNVVSELLKRGANVNAATKKGNTALHIASLAGQEEVVKLLVEKQANVNVQSQSGFTPLYMAAQENHDAVVRFLLAHGANQSLATEDGFTPLAVALQQGHDKVVAVLLENDARGKVRLPALHIASKKDDCKAAALLLHSEHNPDVTSKSGFTPLHIAAHYGNSNIASLLLEKGADVNFPAKHQITPLHVAAKWGKSNMVKLLLEKGAKMDASTRDGLTPLHCAARSGHDQVVEQLLEKNAPITAKTKNGLAPLHMASQGDHVDSARILLYHKAPVDDVTVDYLTALHVAAHCGHVGVAKLLLDRKADPNARALNGFTPLHIACKKNRIKVVELLLKHGASIEATTESGLTPLHVASFMGCMNIVIYLIQHGANPDIPTVRGETPLHLAARANQTDIIRILLRNGAHVDAKARELQTALHIASRLGNADMVGLLLQHGAAVDAPTKDAYTPLHVAAREGQDEVAALLLDHGAALAAPTKKGFTPLHLAAKYGNIKVAKLLLQKDAPVDAQGKNGVTPLHVAAHYDHVNVALLLLEKGASPHAAARNGYTPLHVAARKDQMDIASSLLEYGARPGAESRAGFTPLHLAAQEGHADLAALLVEHGAECDAKAKNGLTPLHLCAQEDRVNVAAILAKSGATIDPTTKAGYTPLHVACHFGQTNMIRFLLRQGANVNATTTHGYTPLHQAAQQGHTLIINLLLEHRASPNATTKQGQTALSIAQRLGYISVVETLKVVTETTVTTTITTVTEEKYKVVAPETMHETFMSDSEDEGAEDNMLGDQSFRYLTADEMKSLGDDSLPIDVTRDERLTESIHVGREPGHVAPLTQEEERLSPTQAHQTEAVFVGNYAPDNVDISRTPIHAGSLISWDGDSCSSSYLLSPSKRMWRERFLVSFLVDARGGAMRGCRHSGVRVIIPPRKAQMPMRITCRYLRKEKLPHPPPLLEGEACASRILEVGPAGAKFLGPVILEVPHFASLRGKEREITILRSDNGETWKEHTLEASEEAVQEVLNESFEGEELSALEDLQTNRITRILTTDFPQYFAVVSRTRQEVHAVGPEGGMLSSTVVPQVQAIFPEGALTKKIRVGLQAQPIQPELVTKLLGHRVAVSPIVTVEPRRRKFHKPITLTIPVPQAATKGMINQYAGDAPTLRLLCSITGGANKAQWEDVTGSTPLTFVNDCVSFTTTVSARFWLMDCRQVSEATKFATELYAEAIHVPFMAKFVVFAKRQDPMEAQLRVFCMTDDKEDKTLETQEHFSEVAKSRDVEVLENKSQYLEFAGNLVPVTKSGEQLKLHFQAFRENRVPFVVRVKDIHQEPLGRVAFMREPRAARTEPPQVPLCNLNIALPEFEASRAVSELVTLEKKYGFVEETGLAKPELIHRADLRLSDIARELGADWVPLAAQLDVPDQDVSSIRSECPSDLGQQALLMLRLWMKRANTKATGNNLEKGLRRINREDIVNKCMFNVELVTDDVEKAVAKVHLDQSGFDTFREELGAPKTSSLKRDASLDVSYDEPDLMKEAESAEETSSETGSVQDRHASSEAKGQGKGSRKGSPISAVLGRLVRGSSKEKAAPTMAIAENFDEEPTTPKRERSEKMKEGTIREASPVATPPDSKKKSKKEKSPPLPASPPSDKSDTKKSGHGSPRSGSLEKDVVVQEVIQAASVVGSKKGKTPEPKEKSVETVPHVPSSEAAKEPPASSAMKTPGENGLSNSKPEEISRGAPPPVPKRDVKKTPGGIVETVEVIKHQVGKVTDLFPKLGKKGKGEKGAPTVSAAEPGAAKGSPAKELKETPGGVVEIVQVTKHEVAKGPEESPTKVKGKSPEKKSPPEADASAEKPSVTTKREIRETPGGLMEVVEVTKHDIGRMPEIDGTFSVGALEGDPSTVVHREVKETPGGLVEVVRVTKHEVGKLPEGESPSVLGDKIADLAKAPGATEGEPSTLVRREVKQVPGGLVEVVEVTKHQVGKALEDKHSPMHGKFPETQIPWEAESQISGAAPSTIIKREVKELPGGHVEVVQVTTHEVGKLPQASDLPGLGESVCDTSITQRIETQIIDGKPTVVRRTITSTPEGVTEEIEPVEPDESQPSDSSFFPKMGDLAKFKEDPSAVVKREVKEIPGGVMEVVSVTKHVTSTTPSVEAGDSLSSQFPPGSLTSERTVSEALSDFPEGIDRTLPGVTRTTVIKKEVSGPDAIVQTTTSVVTSATAPKGKDDLSADLLDKMFSETKPSQPKDSPLKDVLTPAKVRGAAGKVTAEEAELLAQLFPEQEGAGVTMYPPASRTPEAAIIPEYRGWTTAEATSPVDPETKERILLTLGRALSQDDLDAPSPTRGQAVVTPSEEDLKGQVAEPPIERLELPRRISDPPRDDVPSVLAAGAHKVTKATKTPPPSPTTGLHKKDEPLAKTMAFRTKPSEDTVVTSTQVKDVHDDGTVKHTVTTVTKTTIFQEMDEPGSQGPGAAPRAGESEAWASDLDTSQVSVSSLPEDEKTEPTATLSSSATTTTAERDASSSEPLLHTQVEEKEWTETDPDSGGVRHVIRKTTHTTVTSGKQGESALRGGAKSTAETRTTTRDHHQLSDEEESLTFVQKKEFFEKLSEHSPPKDSSRGRLGSTPSLDTTLTRPVATQKPRPRSESLASQGEIVEESIVFSERLRLFQDKDDGSALLEPREAPADLERIEQQVRDVQYQLHTETGLVPDLDQTELQRAQAGPRTERAPSDVRSDVSSTPESLDGKSATRLLVRTSEPGKEAFDMRTTEFSVSEGVQEQQFARVLVRSPVPEDGFDESPATGAPEQLDSALHSAYRESPRPTQQERDHMEGRPKAQAKGIGASVDTTAPEKQLAAEPEEEREQVATAGPAAAVATVATGRSAAGGREEKRSPLLEASPPEETAYRAEQDISPAQEYPDYLTPEMQVRVGVSPTETSPGRSKPRDQVSGTEQAAVHPLESSVESSSDVFSPKAPASDTNAMAFENVAFAGEDVIDASSSPVEESGSSPAGSRSPYEVVRDGATEKAEATVMGAHLALRTEEPQDDDERKDEPPGEKRVTPTRPRSLLKSDEGTPEMHVGSEAELRIETHVYGEELNQLVEESALEKREFSEGLLGAGLLSVGIGDARTPESRRGDSDEDEEEWADHVLSKIQGRPIPPTPPASPRAMQSAVEIEEQVTWEAPVVEQQELSVEVVREIPAEKQVIVEHDEEADKESAVADEDSITARKRPLLEHIPSEISDEDLVEREQSPTHISATCRGDGKDSSSDRNSSPDSDGPRTGGSHRRSASEAAAVMVETEQKQPPDDNKSSDGDHGKKADDKITKDAALSDEAMGVIEEEAPIEFFAEREAHTPDEAQGVPHSSTGKFSSSSGSPPQRKSDGESSATGGKCEGAVVLRSKARTSARKEEKRVSRELDTGHSGSETDQSHYYSFEMTSDSGKTPGVSRPTSSEFDLNILSGHASSEYETCVTSQDGEASGSYATAATSSQEASYATARSSLSGSSRGSAYSVDSESSGHLGSLEASSEASETIVASAHEDLDSDDNESQRSVSGLREPYDGDIPESVIRGGVEVPFLPSWQSVQKGFDTTRASTGQMVERRRETSSFQGVTRDTLAEYMTGSVRWPAEPHHDELDRIGRTEATHASSKLEALNGAAATSDGQRRPRSVDEPVSNEEEQLSVSESSATQSEHTWQTSVETVVDVVQTQRFSCDNERYQRQSTMLDSVPLPLDEPAIVGDAMDAQVQDAADNGATPPFREINGPVEVDYVPEYDDLVAPPRGIRPLDPLADAEFVAAPAEELSNAAEDFLREHTEAETPLQQQQQQVHDEECEGFYAETFQGELSTEEVEGAVSLADRQYAYSTGSDGLSKDNATTKEPFERPATPEPPDEIELQEDDGCFPESDQLKSSQTRLGSREPKAAAADIRVVCSPKTATVVKDDLEDACLNEPESNGSFEFVEKTDVMQTTCEDEPFEIIPAQSDFCPPQSCCLPENKHAATKAYTSKCEDYLMHMQQTYKYGTIVEKNASEGSFPPEEAMDVENVNLLAGKLQEGNGQQGFPYDLSYQQEYADDGRAEYGDLYTHQEVEEEDDDRSRSRSGRRLSPISDERGSTPDYDTLAGRKTFGKGSERDDASTSSLMEFERLEAEMASGGKSSSVGSSDSFSGRLQQARNGGSEQDSVSVNSLTEFEKLEKELVEAEGVDGRLREEPVARLDEIDEGHESQASDPDQELYEGLLRVRGALTESGLQKFVVETEEADGHSGRTRPDTLADHWRDKTQVERDFTSEHTERHFLTSRTESGHSVDSVDRQSSASTATQYDADSLKEREMDDFESNQAPETLGWTMKDAADVDQDSLHESERHDSLQEYPSEEKDSLQGMDPSAEMDSLQDDGNNLQDSLHEAREIDWDSFHGDDLPRDWHRQPSPIRTTELSPTMSRPAVSPLVAPVVIERIDTLTWVGQDGEPVLFPAERLQGDALVSSTDSLEPSSSANTHATYQFETDSMMSSSLTSADESTMVSSTDTLDQEAVRSGLQGRTPALESPFHGGDDTVDSLLDESGEFFFDGNATMRRVKRRPLEGGRPPPDDVETRFREYLLQSVVTPADEEQVEERQTLDERGNVVVTRTVKRHLTSEPQLHTQTFSGLDAEERSRAFVASFSAVQPSADKDEYEGFDDAGNAVRVTQRVLVKPSVKTVTFTGPDARAQMQEYMRNSGVGPQSSAENTPTSDSGVGVCSSLASPPALAPDPPATTLPSTAWPGLRRLSGGDQWMEEESALDESAQPVATSRVITTRTIRTVCPDGQEQVVTTTSCDDDSEVRMRRSMQGVLDSFLADSGPPAPTRGYLDDNEE